MRIAWLPLVSLVLACGGDGRETAVAEGLGGPDVPLAPTAEDVFTVGAMEGEDWEVFGRIPAVRFDDSGNLYVLDGVAMRITVFDPQGGYLRTVGKQGGGPGEFQAPFAFTVFPDGGVAVFDIGKRGFEVFDPMGAYVGSVPVDLTEGGPGSLVLPLPDGRVVSAGGFQIRMGPGGAEEPEEEGRPVDVFSLDDGSREVLYRAWEAPPAPEGEAQTLEGGGGRSIAITMATRAYEADLHFGVLSSGQVAVVDSTGYRVKLVDPDGSLAGVVERPISAQAMTEGLRQAERERRLAALEGQGSANLMVVGGSGGMQVDQEQIREMMRGQVEAMTFAEEVPVISALAIDTEDRMWVQRHGPDGEAEGPIDVIGPGREYFGTVRPDAFSVPDAFGPNGLVAYIESDELDVQRVRVARLAPLR